MPSWSAAWMMVVPGGTVTVRPSMVSVGMRSHKIAGTGGDVMFELRAEFPDVGLDGPGRRVGEHADGLALHAAGARRENVKVPRAPVAMQDAGQLCEEPPGPLAARRALPARLVREELSRRPKGLHHAGGVVHHDDPAGAGH